LVNDDILDENKINKLLGVLSNNGVYAMWVYAKSQKDIEENRLFREILNNLDLKLIKKDDLDDLENYFQSVSSNITKLLFLKQLLEKILIYARYHAKVLKGEKNE
jgi:hypothetical protein